MPILSRSNENKVREEITSILKDLEGPSAAEKIPRAIKLLLLGVAVLELDSPLLAETSAHDAESSSVAEVSVAEFAAKLAELNQAQPTPGSIQWLRKLLVATLERWEARDELFNVTKIKKITSRQDFYKRLGASPSESYEKIRQRYRSIMQKIHRDHYHHFTVEMKEVAEETARLVNEAWECLRDDDKRFSYNGILGLPTIWDVSKREKEKSKAKQGQAHSADVRPDAPPSTPNPPPTEKESRDRRWNHMLAILFSSEDMVVIEKAYQQIKMNLNYKKLQPHELDQFMSKLAHRRKIALVRKQIDEIDQKEVADFWVYIKHVKDELAHAWFYESWEKLYFDVREHVANWRGLTYPPKEIVETFVTYTQLIVFEQFAQLIGNTFDNRSIPYVFLNLDSAQFTELMINALDNCHSVRFLMQIVAYYNEANTLRGQRDETRLLTVQQLQTIAEAAARAGDRINDERLDFE